MKFKNKIFIILCLFISGVIILFITLLLLAINKPQPKVSTINQPTLKTYVNTQQEQETYNKLMNKIEKEIDKLTQTTEIEKNQQQEQTTSLKYPPKIEYQSDGKTIYYIKEYKPQTGEKIKETWYKSDGKTIDYIEEFDSDGNVIEKIYYNPDFKITSIELYNPNKSEVIKETFYNQDGTIKEIKIY